jgi:hypothetical protein
MLMTSRGWEEASITTAARWLANDGNRLLCFRGVALLNLSFDKVIDRDVLSVTPVEVDSLF